MLQGNRKLIHTAEAYRAFSLASGGSAQSAIKFNPLNFDIKYKGDRGSIVAIYSPDTLGLWREDRDKEFSDPVRENLVVGVSTENPVILYLPFSEDRECADQHESCIGSKGIGSYPMSDSLYNLLEDAATQDTEIAHFLIKNGVMGYEFPEKCWNDPDFCIRALQRDLTLVMNLLVPLTRLQWKEVLENNAQFLCFLEGDIFTEEDRDLIGDSLSERIFRDEELCSLVYSGGIGEKAKQTFGDHDPYNESSIRRVAADYLVEMGL